MPTNQSAPQSNRSSQASINTEKTDAEMVFSMLSSLEDKLHSMDEKFDQIQLDEKKHYDSLRRGLRRVKEDKPAPQPADLINPTDLAVMEKNVNGQYPCCICNYCLKRTFPCGRALTIANVVTYVMCKDCDNFTLCVDCFMDDKKYHHHPAHAFTVQNSGNYTNQQRMSEVSQRLGPGRGLKHRAHCDACKNVFIPLDNFTDNNRILWVSDINASNVVIMIFVTIVSNRPRQFILAIRLLQFTIISLPCSKVLSPLLPMSIVMSIAMGLLAKMSRGVSAVFDLSAPSARISISASVANRWRNSNLLPRTVIFPLTRCSKSVFRTRM